MPQLLDKPLGLWPNTAKWLHESIGALGDLRGDIEDWFDQPINDPAKGEFLIFGDSTLCFTDKDTTSFHDELKILLADRGRLHPIGLFPAMGAGEIADAIQRVKAGSGQEDAHIVVWWSANEFCAQGKSRSKLRRANQNLDAVGKPSKYGT